MDLPLTSEEIFCRGTESVGRHARSSVLTANLMPERVDLSLTSGGNFRPGAESAGLRARSSVITTRNSRVVNQADDTTYFQSGGLDDVGFAVGARHGIQASVEQVLESGNYLPDSAYEQLLH